VLATMLEGMEDFFSMLREYGVVIHNTGGETADVADLVQTLIFDATAFSRIPRQEVITNEDIQDGDVILGLASFGQTVYESSYNAGTGSNGLTNARHDVLKKASAQHLKNSFIPEIKPSRILWRGRMSMWGRPCSVLPGPIFH